MDRSKLTRRVFLRNAAVAFPVGVIAIESTAQAQDMPHLDPEDPTAKALFYVHDASEIDASQPGYANYEDGEHCGNCIQLQGEEGEEWRPCALFPGKLVAAAGWCAVWVAKPENG